MQGERSALFNLSAAALAEAGIKAAQFATVVLIARSLGPEGFGVVGAAWALFQLAIPVVHGAPELLGIRTLSADRSGGARTVVEIATLRTVLALAALAALAIYGLVQYGPSSPGLPQTVAQAGVLLAMAAAPGWAARSFQRSELYAGPRLAQACLFVLLSAGALAIWPSPLVVPLADGLAWAVAAGLGFRVLRPLLPGLNARRVLAVLADRPRLRRALAGYGRDTFRLAAAGVAAAAIWWVPVLMVESLFGAAAGGHVAAAVRLVLIALAALHLGLQVYLPILAKHHAADREKFRQLVAALVVYSTIAHLAAALPLVLLAGPLTALVFGPGFEPAVPLVAIFAAALVPIGMSSGFGYALIAAGRSRAYFILCAAGAVAALAGQFIGVAAAGTASGVIWGIPALLAQALAFALYARAAGLVDFAVMSPRRLAPHSIKAFLLER